MAQNQMVEMNLYKPNNPHSNQWSQPKSPPKAQVVALDLKVTGSLPHAGYKRHRTGAPWPGDTGAPQSPREEAGTASAALGTAD